MVVVTIQARKNKGLINFNNHIWWWKKNVAALHLLTTYHHYPHWV